MKKIVLEIIAFTVVLAISAALSLKVLTYSISNNNKGSEVVVSAKVEKVALKISSPAFALIDKLTIEPGEGVVKGQTLAVLKNLAGEDERVTFEDEIFSSDGDLIYVKSPVDGVIAEVFLAEKSTVKPQLEFIAMYPNTGVRVRLSMKDDLKDKKALQLTVSNEIENYPLTLIDALPVKLLDKEKNVYYAEFINSEDAKYFYNNQDVEVALSGTTDIKVNPINVIFKKFADLSSQ